MENNIVMGEIGASEQVTFIRQCCPVGSHVVVLDDNITGLYEKVGNELQPMRCADSLAEIAEMEQIR